MFLGNALDSMYQVTLSEVWIFLDCLQIIIHIVHINHVNLVDSTTFQQRSNIRYTLLKLKYQKICYDHTFYCYATWALFEPFLILLLIIHLQTICFFG